MRSVTRVAHTQAMTPAMPPCEHVDVALSLQQMIRERETSQGGVPATVAIGSACGDASIGSIDTDGVRHHFCGDHVLRERVVRD